MGLKIIFRNAELCDDLRLALEEEMAQRVIELAGGQAQAKAYWEAPDRIQNPCSHFNRLVLQSKEDAFRAMEISPTLRQHAKFSVLWLPE